MEITKLKRGLTLAVALNRLNIACTVYEARSKEFETRRIGIYERIRDKSLQLDVLTSKDGKDQTTDEYYFGSEKLYGYNAIRIMRKELLDETRIVLRERDIPIQYDYGQVAYATLIIGVDGIYSTVCGTFFLPQVKPMYAGFMGIGSVVKRSQLLVPEGYKLPTTKPDGSQAFIGSKRRFAELDSAGWEGLRKDKKKLFYMLQENKSDWPDVVQPALEATPVERMVFWAFYRVILVGDAAHAIPPTAGQRADQAFEDVRAFATLLSKLSPEVLLDKSIAKWQAYRQERVKKVLGLTMQMNAKRLPESDRAKMPPGAIWSDHSLTRGDGWELRWLCDPDLTQEAEKWVEEIKPAPQP
ncbi:Uu.00g091190.m01.CDS01 [Anthostomella pinea]|uniref:Uu.00g091190.m01.CDS01 n=1 Tax=Anthostomella pinea TaxID=933095 RepID=A0AAI8VN47_9PEZI|nr:Uu.00g091190.m01.CDS01 [Anthostomella pinea]